jgi:serine/threonine-protein kinase
VSEWLASFAGLTPQEARRIDALCERFAKAWEVAAAEGRPGPRLETFLDELPPAARRAGLGELFRVERDQRRRQGEAPAAADYRGRFPGASELLARLLREPEEGAGGTTSGVGMRGGAGEEWPAVPGYRLMRRLGRGGMGEVYLACQLFPTPDEALRPVALKTIRPDLMTSREHRERFIEEVKKAARLEHPHVVRTLHVGPTEGLLWFTMPLLPGGSLAGRVAGTPLPSRPAAELLLPVVRAVEYLHAQGLVHLDLKPANVLLDGEGRPQVADFGMARLLPADGASYVTQDLGGTVSYMAPEQVDGRVSTSCDVYGLGAVLYEMLTGRPPFRGATAPETLRQVRESEPVPPRALNPGVDRGLEAVCLKCLEKEPRHRYASAAALAADVQAVLDGGVPAALRQSWWGWLRRQVSSPLRLDRAERWGRALFYEAGLTLTGHAALYGLLRTGPPAWLCWVWVLLLMVVGEWGPWLLVVRRGRTEPRERDVLLFWVAAAFARLVLFGLFCPPLGPAAPGQVVWVYPAWAALYGVMLFVEGRLYWGRLYLAGLADFAVALLLPLRIDLAPLLFGLWNSAVLVWIGVNLRRPRGGEARKENL